MADYRDFVVFTDALPILVYKGCVQSDPHGCPFKDPRTGIFYSRRVIPAPLRPFVNGAASEYKQTLGTRNPEVARERYHPRAVAYEQKLASAKWALGSGLVDHSQMTVAARAMAEKKAVGQRS
jgi:hypothetical protein